MTYQLARRRHLAAFAIALALTGGGVVAPALAQQQGQQWFVPGQQPAQAQRAQRPPQQAQRPPQQRRNGPPQAMIGVIGIPEVMRASVAAQAVQKEIEERRAKLNDDAQAEQMAWRTTQQELIGQRATLTAEQMREKERELQERINNAQRTFRDRSLAIQRAGQQALAQIEQVLAQIVREVAEERGINLVLHRHLVVLNVQEFEMTETVAQKLNERLRSVPVPEGS